jgi:HEAT repeat protein
MNFHLEPYTDIVNLLRRWGDGFKDENAPEILALRQYNVEQITKAMSAILAFADEDLRFHAVDAIPYLVSDEVVTDLLLPYLTDPNPILRWVLCELFHGVPDARVVLPLAKLLEDDVDPDVRVVAAEALFAVGDERAMPALVYAAEHDDGKDFEDRTVSYAARQAILAIEKRTKSV